MSIDTNKKTILMVDDEEMLVMIAKEILEDFGYNVFVETNGLVAEENFNKNPELYDLVVCDLSMPEISGIDLITKFKAIRPNLPVILCTGYEEGDLQEEMKKCKIDLLIQKPFEISELAEEIGKILK